MDINLILLEKNMKTVNKYLKENISMKKEMEKEKNIMKMAK